ncbi:MAG: hypothetical protein ABI193_09330 [Minicystis sp.]
MQRLRLSFVSLASFSLASLSLALSGGAVASLTACGGSGGSGTGGSGGAEAPLCFDYTGYDGTTPATTFVADVLPIFRLSCGLSASCHGTESGHPDDQHFLGPKTKDPTPTALQIQAIFDQNVGVSSLANPDMKIIDPGHPETSFLMFKLDGVQCDALTCATKAKNACKDLMPLGNTKPMDAAKRDIIRRWIKQGAMND